MQGTRKCLRSCTLFAIVTSDAMTGSGLGLAIHWAPDGYFSGQKILGYFLDVLGIPIPQVLLLKWP